MQKKEERAEERKEMVEGSGAALLAISVGVITFAVYLCYESLWGKRERARRMLMRQGITGPPPSFVYGNTPEMKRISQLEEGKKRQSGFELSPVEPDYGFSLFPYYERWRTEYGPMFLYSMGSIQRLYVSRLDLIKEIGQYKSLDLGRPIFLQKEHGPLFGRGILASNGAEWAHQRKVIAPEFFMEKVKAMVALMVEAAIPLLELWDSQIEREGETIVVDGDLRNFSADVISRACFGSSYSKGKEIFSKLRDLQKVMTKASLQIGIPGMRYLPTKNNRDLWRLEQEIRLSILNIVKERKEKFGASHEKDLLQSILENSTGDRIGTHTTESFIVDNCKNIYFAGHETTAVSAAWCLMLLAKYPEWQFRARAEAVKVLGGNFPDFDMLKKMKILTMVIQETLRLYPPGASASREPLEDIKLGEVFVPRGVSIWVPISVIHRNPEIWGLDAHKFNPERFSRGIAGACKVPYGYIPFGLGPRTCVGQNFALVELKIVLSLILSKFTFSLSPKYRHSPAWRLIVEPEFGVHLNMKRL